MEEEIINKVLRAFTDRVGMKATWKKAPAKMRGLELDGYVQFRVGKHTLEMPAEIKNRVTAATLPQLQAKKQKLGKLLLLANIIMPRDQQRLKALGIFFMDGAGNVFIQQDGFFVHAEGRKIQQPVITDARAFSKGGLKVIFQFFLHEELVNRTIREIAVKTEVSLDTVHKTINALKAMGYLLQATQKQLAWDNKKELLTHWINEYDRRLKPGLFISRFDFLHDQDYDRWKQVKLEQPYTCWGGEPAAELLTGNLKPGEWTMYTTETEMNLVKRYRVMPKKAGVIVAYKRFWPRQDKEPKFAPPLLVYADLVNTGERRNIETAQRIFDEYLKDKF